MNRQSYQSLGGLDESYILGDFEDSDLCMKARAEGMNIVLAEDVSLYHLERQSQSLVSARRWKSELTYYNCWYHTDKWHEHITQLKQDGLREYRH
jgi:GT2 family glycosyltransferase